MAESTPAVDTYDQTLGVFLREHNEESLYRASLLSQAFVESGLGPEDIIALHFEALERELPKYSYREQARAVADAHQFLLEIMIAYGIRYREYLELRLAQTLREAEARADFERERALQAEKAEQEKTEILGTIAHELRTPLTAALGSLDLAARSISRGQLDRLPPLIGSTRDALSRLSRLTADLVEASRGELSIVRSPIQLDGIISQACGWARATATVKAITLTHKAGPAVQILGSEDALLSLFGNLLSNAIRYTPAGGSVTVRHGAAGGVVWVEVADNGVGIPPEYQQRIFEKFYRTPEARQLEARGLGLGLALVQQLVHAHAGRVTLQSEPGHGSVFRIELPEYTGTTEETLHG